MNLAIEYALRTGILKQLIKLPISLFIYNYKQPNECMVVTISNTFGGSQDTVSIKHWQVSKCEKKEILPPYAEYNVPRAELFSNERVIVPCHNVVEYEADPFPAGQKQMSDPPYNQTQETKYRECIDNFFYNKKHKNKRRDWLWSLFMEQFLPHSYKEVFRSHSVDSQQNVISESFPVVWKGWLMWNKYLLNFDGIAPELVFANEYEDKLKSDGFLHEEEIVNKRKKRASLLDYSFQPVTSTFTVPTNATFTTASTVNGSIIHFT